MPHPLPGLQPFPPHGQEQPGVHYRAGEGSGAGQEEDKGEGGEGEGLNAVLSVTPCSLMCLFNPLGTVASGGDLYSPSPRTH